MHFITILKNGVYNLSEDKGQERSGNILRLKYLQKQEVWGSTWKTEGLALIWKIQSVGLPVLLQ